MSLNSIEICQDWLSYIKSEITELTYIRYNRTMESYIIPYVSNHSLDTLNEDILNQYLLQQKENGCTPTVLSRMKAIFVGVFKYGYRLGILDTLDARKIKLPQYSLDEVSINKEEADIIYHYCIKNKTSINIAILLAMFTGIRIGELCALQFKDIHQNIIHITKTVQRNNNHKHEIVHVHHWAHQRDIIIPDFLLNDLLEYWKPIYDFNNYIATQNHKFGNPRTLQAKVAKISKEIGIEFSFHSLRNYFYHTCMESGMNIYTLMALYGVSQTKIKMEWKDCRTIEEKNNALKHMKWFDN